MGGASRDHHVKFDLEAHPAPVEPGVLAAEGLREAWQRAVAGGGGGKGSEAGTRGVGGRLR